MTVVTQSSCVPPVGTPVVLVARTIDITPRTPVVLASSRVKKPAARVFEPLEANLLLLRHRDKAFLFATLDLLYPGAAVRQALAAEMGEADAENVLVGASHTHYAPSTLDDKSALGTVDSAYVDSLVSALRAATRSMLDESGSPVPLWSIGVRDLDHSINRRLVTPHGVRMAPNRAGPRDERATVIVVGDRQAPSAVIWNYACHPVSHPRPGMVAAHYPAVVRDRLRRAYNRQDLPVLFFQGFSGDTRPSATTRIRRPRDLAQRLRFGAGFYDMSLRAYRHWSGTLAEAVVDTARSARPVPVTALSARRAVFPLTDFVEGGRTGKEVSFQRLDLTPSASFVGGSAEMVSSFAMGLRATLSADRHLLPVGCLDDCFGYLPTERMMLEGGYEAGGFCASFGYRSIVADAPARGRAALRLLTGGP